MRQYKLGLKVQDDRNVSQNMKDHRKTSENCTPHFTQSIMALMFGSPDSPTNSSIEEGGLGAGKMCSKGSQFGVSSKASWGTSTSLFETFYNNSTIFYVENLQFYFSY